MTARDNEALPDPDDRYNQIVGRNDGGPLQLGEDTVDEADAERPAPIEKASGGAANADRAAEAAPADRQPNEDLAQRQDQLLEEAVEETFPASDPVSPKRVT